MHGDSIQVPTPTPTPTPTLTQRSTSIVTNICTAVVPAIENITDHVIKKPTVNDSHKYPELQGFLKKEIEYI